MSTTGKHRVCVVTPDKEDEDSEQGGGQGPGGGGGGLECSIYQNFGAAEVMVQGMAGMVDQADVEAIVRAQKKMLQRFEKTNEMLSNCNNLSRTRMERATRDFKAHSQHLVQLKRDLDAVFKRIRALRAKVAAQHPEAYAAVAADEGGGAAANADNDGKEEDDEYDVAIRERHRQQHTEHQNTRISPIPEQSSTAS